MLESVFLAIAAVFSAFGLFCFVKLWFSDLGNDAYSAIFLESGDDSEILDRFSFNFSIAVYDLDSNILYYFEMDT